MNHTHTTFVRMPTSKQMLAMGIPELPEAAFGGDLPPTQRKALVQAMGIRPQGGGGGGLKAVVAVVAAVAIPFAAPAIASSIGLSAGIGSALASTGLAAGAAATAGSVIGSAIIGAGLGAVSGAITGQNVGRSALMGGIGGGIGGYLNAPQMPQAPGISSGIPQTVTPAAGQTQIGIANLGDASAVATYNPASGTYTLANGAAVDPSMIAYGGQVESGLAAQLSSTNDTMAAATAIQKSGTLAVNTPTALGGNAAALGTTSYYDPNLTQGAQFATQSAPAYQQAGLKITPTTERIASVQAAFDPTSSQNLQLQQTQAAAAKPGAAGGTTQPVPTTVSEALKQKFTDPRNQADMILRAAGQLAGSQIAGDGLSDEEKQLLNEQRAELETLRTTNQALFNQRLQEAQNIIGESKYFDPSYFGLQAARQVQTSGSRAKREALSKIAPQRAGLRRSEERRFDLGIGTGSQTAYLQGADAAQTQKLKTLQTGLGLAPTSGPTTSLQYGQYIGNLYDAADRRRRQTAGDIGDLFGSFTGQADARRAGVTINI